MIDSQTPLHGTPMEDLDTPCLVIDLDALDHNMDVIADYYRDRPSKLRGHAKNHKTPAIALRQIRRGGTIGGVCAAKVSEAEVMVHGGVPERSHHQRGGGRPEDTPPMLPGRSGRGYGGLRQHGKRPRPVQGGGRPRVSISASSSRWRPACAAAGCRKSNRACPWPTILIRCRASASGAS